jgi:tetratricopeptide (TPR) repeat protein
MGPLRLVLIVTCVSCCDFAIAQDNPPEVKAPDKAPTLTDARSWYLSGEYDRAAEAYNALTQDAATRADAGVGLAECRVAIGEYGQALTGLTELNATSDASWHVGLAQVYRIVGDYAKAESHAREALRLDKSFVSARRFLGELLEYLGRRAEAVKVYAWFDQRMVAGGDLPREPAWMTDVGVGFLRYSELTQTNVLSRTEHVLQEMLQMAYGRLDRSYYPARLAAADLLRRKFSNDDTDGSVSDYEGALRINPNLPAGHVGLGRVALEGWRFEEIENRVEKALETNAKYAPAIHLLAHKEIVERRYAQASETAQRALKINENDLVALSLWAGAEACQYNKEKVREIEARVKAINPNCAPYYRMLGDTLGGIRQYAASEKHYLRAIELDATDANARTELGMMYMQWGLEKKARDALDGAWAIDPYNQRTKFTLELLDGLSKFAVHETEHFLIHYDEKRDPGLGAFIATLLEPIYETVTSDYGVEPDVKTIIEFFPTHRQFGVRITGKPWIHTVGACTGSVIALATPRKSADLMGRYNVRRVLLHEFTHTVTLAATENRIPHWFTEGLAVFGEDAPRSFDWMVLLAEATRQDRLFTLESIDWGFMRPKRASDRQMAYAQSEWMCEFIAERFGYDMLGKMLSEYRGGRTQKETFTDLLKIETDTFDAEFVAWAKPQVKRWGFDLRPSGDVFKLRDKASSPTVSAKTLGQLARAELDVSELDRALDAARRAIELDENEVDALEVLSRILFMYSEGKVPEPLRDMFEKEALPAAKRLLAQKPENWAGLKVVGQVMLYNEEWDKAETALKTLQRVCPADPFSWRGLAGIYLHREDDAKALSHLLELARIEQNDPDIPGTLGDIVRRTGNAGEASYWYREALSIDPFSVEYHQALAENAAETGRIEESLIEYEILTQIEPHIAKHFESAAITAKRLGRKELVQKYARRAVALDAKSTVKHLLDGE